MKAAPSPVAQAARHQKLLEAARASFRIEGIHISEAQAQTVLRQVELSLRKAGA